MDNIIESNSKPTKPNPSPKAQLRSLKHRDRAFSDMKYLEYLRTYGNPPAPLFKPLEAPHDSLVDMELLPPSELSDKEDTRKILSCPTGLNLVQEEEEMVEEDEDGDRFEMPGTSGTQMQLEPVNERKMQGYNKPLKVPTRFRSRSENLNNGSIFKFMENTLGGRKEHLGASLF